ncbi:hypothetical protein ALI144C_07340 [Actinosynnema sp. ALI-1.44]|uniref:non-ribosomal peptide synthetase n=1 Tax=Actinosynnema sp. ALI-1.44 TaxID=1933779 RepID=UPI00097CB1F0|nr:non-ribosomal peptide synthetase [Actinosynnema sp. ALI-1.44]ONI88253.1 hypothetical protein ALI144C_07340 [Actinosynnema sp. ALI-1.44]
MHYPMSAEQEGIWLSDQLQEKASRFVVPWVHRLRGRVDSAALTYALSAVVRRHEPLRSRLTVLAGRPVQVVCAAEPVRLRIMDVGEADLDAVLHQVVRQPLPLDRSPLLHATLLRVGAEEAVLCLAIHHAVLDGWSLGLLNHEISEYYAEAVGAAPARVPHIALRYGEHTRRAVVTSRDLQFWRATLHGVPAQTTVPPDRQRPATLGVAGGWVPVVMDGRIGAVVRRFARQARVTPFAVLMSALSVLVGRLSGQQDTVIGTPVSRRDTTELEPLIACLTDVMPVRARPAPETSFAEFVASVAQAVRDMIAHRHVSYRDLVRECVADWSLSGSPLFQIVLTLDDAPPSGLVLPGVTAEQLPVHNGTAKYDLFLDLAAVAGGFSGGLEYSTELFDRSTAERFVSRWQTVLVAALAEPRQPIGDLDILLVGERVQLGWWSTTRPAVVRPLAHEAFLDQARAAPDRVAVIDDRRSLSYGELAARSDALAARLGPGPPGRRVAVLLRRSAELPLAMLAIMRAGACCVVIDPDLPAERIAFMLGDSGATTVITRQSKAIAHGPWRLVLIDDPTDGTTHPPEISPEDLAYVVYTSGSTGLPKGVAMPHRSLANLVAWQVRTSGCGAGTRTMQAATPGFDVVFQEVFATWAAGGTLVVAEGRRDAERLLDLVERHRVNRVFLGFFALQQVAEYAVATNRAVPSLREVISSGEQVHVTPAIRVFFQRIGASLENQYGPSETHVVTAERLAGPPASWPTRPPIGRPVDGAEVRVLDDRLRPQPAGVIGEIYVAGVPVADGYIGHPELTRERFERHADVPLYRTGDLGRLLPDGRIEFVGRTDHQVKVRGFRVELGEVESVLKEIAGIRDAVVVAHDGALVAYYIGDHEPQRLREAMARRLPGHAVPFQFVAVDHFPLTTSGKPDRAALRPVPARRSHTTVLSPRQQRIADIWAELLGVDDVGADDDFFALGGNSLSATRVALRLRAELAAPIPVAAIFTHSTVARLTTLISGGQDTAHVAVRELADDIGPVPSNAVIEPREVLLTGSTGFLGGYLLRELLTRTEARVHCLVRGAGPHVNMIRLGLWESSWENRVVVHRGDLARPLLGLSTATFDELASTVDVIYHAGAVVNLTWPFERLMKSNVDGTEEVLRLAAHRRTVPVHHVSTAGVHVGPGRVCASDPLPPMEKLDNGYALSKWQAEQLLAQARARGLPVSVYRPTRIAPDSTSGACGHKDFLWLVLKACVQAAAAPAGVGLAFDLVAVDYVSAAIVGLSRREPGTYHLASERLVRLTALVDELRAIGYQITDVASADWLQMVAADPANAAFPLLGLLSTELTSAGSEGTVLVSAHETRMALRGTGIEPLPFGRAGLRAAVSYLQRTEFLPPVTST